eukprot:g78015.t1
MTSTEHKQENPVNVEQPPALPGQAPPSPIDPAKNIMARQYFEAAYQAALMQATQESMAQAGRSEMLNPMMAGYMGMPGGMFGMPGMPMPTSPGAPKKRARGMNSGRPKNAASKKRKKDKDDGMDDGVEGILEDTAATGPPMGGEDTSETLTGEQMTLARQDVELAREDLHAALRVVAHDTVSVQKGKYSCTYYILDTPGQVGYVFQKAKRPRKPTSSANSGTQSRHRAQLREMANQILSSLSESSNFEPVLLRTIFGEQWKPTVSDTENSPVKGSKMPKTELGPPYKRPRGAAPKGKEWNTDTGEWNTKNGDSPVNDDGGHDGIHDHEHDVHEGHHEDVRQSVGVPQVQGVPQGMQVPPQVHHQVQHQQVPQHQVQHPQGVQHPQLQVHPQGVHPQNVQGHPQVVRGHPGVQVPGHPQVGHPVQQPHQQVQQVQGMQPPGVQGHQVGIPQRVQVPQGVAQDVQGLTHRVPPPVAPPQVPPGLSIQNLHEQQRAHERVQQQVAEQQRAQQVAQQQRLQQQVAEQQRAQQVAQQQQGQQEHERMQEHERIQQQQRLQQEHERMQQQVAEHERAQQVSEQQLAQQVHEQRPLQNVMHDEHVHEESS